MVEHEVDIAGSALENLVHQFANPLDFLRELVQNAIDAGTPRVVVRLSTVGREAEEELVRIAVEDAGEGMDERVIDGELTRLFASSKEGDLTRIGRFGVGFVSVFAIRPEAVQVITGRHGEAWELWFHPDRSFDKARLDRPVHGTTVAVFKRLPSAAAARLVEDCRSTLAYWCEHAEIPVILRIGEEEDGAAPDAGDDPFAGFEAAMEEPGERIGQPFGLVAEPVARVVQDGAEAVVGYGDRRYGFYNGGLTLISTADPAALGAFAPVLGHLAIKVRDRRLGYTVTRDNVLQNEAFERVMRVAVAAAARARLLLLDGAEEACRLGEPLAKWHRLLAAESRAQAGRDVQGWAGWNTAWTAEIANRELVRDHRRRPVRIRAVREQITRFGTVIWTDHPLEPEVAAACDQAGVAAIEGTADTAAFLGSLGLGPAYGAGNWPVTRYDAWFEWAEPVEPSGPEGELIAAASELATAAVGVRMAVGRRVLWWKPTSALSVLLTRFRLRRPGLSDPAALLGTPTGGLVRRGGTPDGLLPRPLQRRHLLIDRDHPLFRTLAARWVERPGPAALALAQVLLEADGRREEGPWRRLAAAWRGRWGKP
jgi:hypothetical protein